MSRIQFSCCFVVFDLINSNLKHLMKKLISKSHALINNNENKNECEIVLILQWQDFCTRQTRIMIYRLETRSNVLNKHFVDFFDKWTRSRFVIVFVHASWHSFCFIDIKRDSVLITKHVTRASNYVRCSCHRTWFVHDAYVSCIIVQHFNSYVINMNEMFCVENVWWCNAHNVRFLFVIQNNDFSN